MKKTNPIHSELIKSYLIETYTFGTDKNDWCVIDKVYGGKLDIQKLIKTLNKIFPNMDSTAVVTSWWANNIAINTGKIFQFLSNYKLVQTNRGMVWSTVSRSGNDFNIDDLMKVLPSHFEVDMITKVYEEWFDDQKYEETKKLIHGKHRHI